MAQTGIVGRRSVGQIKPCADAPDFGLRWIATAAEGLVDARLPQDWEIIRPQMVRRFPFRQLHETRFGEKIGVPHFVQRI